MGDGKLAKQNSNRYTKPLFVDGVTSFNFTGQGVPAGITNYTGGNYYLTISGNIGDSYLTVLGGNIAHAGTSQKWAAVVKDDYGNWKPYQVTGTDGINKVYIYPNLHTNIINGEIGNLHDADEGQHYTERGYFALAQYIFNTNKRYAERNKYLYKFLGTDTTGAWVKIGSPLLQYNNNNNIINASGLVKNNQSRCLDVYCYGSGITQGVSWTANVKNKNGFLELYIGAKQDVDTLIVEFYLDGVLKSTIAGLGKEGKRLTFPYQDAVNAMVKAYIPNCAIITEIRIGNTTWWVNELPIAEGPLIPQNSDVVFIGDSWGEYHSQAITRELSRLVGKEVINKAKSGHTSKWAKEWFEHHVIYSNPIYVIIEYFVNDYNSANGTVLGTYIGVDGSSVDMNVTQADWLNNIKSMCDMAIQNGIQPIVLCNCITESLSQGQDLANYGILLTNGELLV
jgi:hypothetical protein